jgi:hypothetical protein
MKDANDDSNWQSEHLDAADCVNNKSTQSNNRVGYGKYASHWSRPNVNVAHGTGL